jgi:hypothetical protein
MPGTIIALNADGTTSREDVADANVLEKLQKIVGGHIETVPYWDRISIDGVTRRCWAVVNEDGKLIGLPSNAAATYAWYANAPTMRGVDSLCGNVAVCFGDDSFMRAL